MKNSVKKVQDFGKVEIIQKEAQQTLKGGVHLIKMCDIGLKTGG